jgi:phosphoribosyl 1,2-cyclic phosphodiesterase
MKGIILGSVDWYDSPFGRRTSCIFFPEKNIVLDAGTGFVNLPNYLQSKEELHIMISHGHNDHIYGLWPAYDILNGVKKLKIYGHPHILRSLENLFDRSSSGYSLSSSNFNIETILFENDATLDVNGVKVETKRFGPHTIKVNCYKLFLGDKVLSYVPDLPISRTSKHGILDFLEGSTTVIHNCFEHSKPSNDGFKAHITYADELGGYFKGKVKRLILIGMNPTLVGEFDKFADNVWTKLEPWQEVVFSYDGMQFDV